MKFDKPLVRGRFLHREKRFLIHAELDDGRRVIAHTNNTGRMSGCLAAGCPVWLSPADDPRRKLKWTLEVVETVADPDAGTAAGVLVGVNTARANRLVAEAIAGGLAPPLSSYATVRAEVRYGSRNSRADFLLQELPGDPEARCWVEVKNVTLVGDRHARFPDAPSERGRKHLRELTDMIGQGHRAALVFCVQRGDARSVGSADDIDPAYGRALREAVAGGLLVLGLRCRVTPEEIEIVDSIPLRVI
jgi:sugar fermentation stimulation protein A